MGTIFLLNYFTNKIVNGKNVINAILVINFREGNVRILHMCVTNNFLMKAQPYRNIPQRPFDFGL